MTKIIAPVQVRMGSSRFPGKVMYEINGKPLLGHLLDRLNLSNSLNGVVVATSDSPENDIIETYCNNRNVFCYRGSEKDVLGRTLKALQMVNASIGVEVFGDCPLIDPEIVDFMIDEFLNDQSKPDFVGNDLKTTFPPGMDVEVFNVKALEEADKQVSDPYIREHGTLFIRQNPHLFSIKNIEAKTQWNRPELEMEVDVKEDIYVVSEILNCFSDKPNFTLEEIIRFLDSRPDLIAINKDVPRRWKKHRGEDA